MRKTWKKRSFAMMMAIIMCLSVIHFTAAADETTKEETKVEQTDKSQENQGDTANQTEQQTPGEDKKDDNPAAPEDSGDKTDPTGEEKGDEPGDSGQKGPNSGLTKSGLIIPLPLLMEMRTLRLLKLPRATPSVI